jgi:hypothetical protein
MEAAKQTKIRPESNPEEGIRSPLLPDLVLHPIPGEVLEQARAAVPRLRALQEAILARRGGLPFAEEELAGALREARAAHERGE